MNTRERLRFVNITPQVEELVAKSGVQEGLVLVNAMHITASVFVNDDEPGLHRDMTAPSGCSSRSSASSAVRPSDFCGRCFLHRA